MNKEIGSWLVEEVDPKTNQKTFSQEYDSSSEAYEMYDQLVKENPNTMVSVTRQKGKRLLVE